MSDPVVPENLRPAGPPSDSFAPEGAELPALIARVLEHITDACVALDHDDCCTYVNRHAEQILGRSRKELLGRSIWEVFPDAVGDGAYRAIRRAREERVPVTSETWAATLGLWLESRIFPSADGLVIYFRDITQRKKTEEDRRAGAERLSVILDNVKDIVFLLEVDPEGEFRFQFINPAFLAATGLRAGQVIGRRVQEVIPEPAHALVLDKYAEAIRERRPVEWQETSAYPSGERIGDVRVTPLFDAQGRGTHLLGTVHDITALRHAQGRSEQLLALSTALGEAVTVDEVAEAIIQAALPIFQAGMGLVTLLSEDGRRLDSARIVGVPPAEADAWRSFPTEARVPLADAVRERRLVVLATEEAHDAAYPTMAQERAAAGVGALVAVPLLAGERCVGGLGLICPSERCRSEEQQTFLWTLAGQCALALDRARLYDAERRAREELRDAHGRTAGILESITDGFHALDREWRFTYLNDQAERLVFRTRAELLGENIWEAFPESVGSTFERQYRRAVAEQTPVSFEEYYPPLSAWLEVRAYPSADGLSVYFRDISARKAAEAERDRRLAEQQARAERESLINRIGAAFRSSSDPDTVQEKAVTLLAEVLGADRCYLALYNLAAGTVTVVRDWHRPDLPSLQGRYPFANTAEMFRELYQDTDTSVIADARVSPLSAQTRAAMEGLGLRARVSVALADADGLTATLTAAMVDGPRGWTAEEVALIEAVATQLRVGVEAARIQQREHRIAEQLQAALQPPTPTHVPGLALAQFYRPAWADQGVGGDFSDVFGDDTGVTFLAVGDLSGKGLAAASQVATVRHMLRFALLNGRTLAGPIAALNRTLADHDLLTGFATLFVARYEAANGRLCYVNCGQDAGLVRRAATGAVQTLPPTGPVLGAVAGAAYAEGSVVLEAGDALALFTDGLTEAGPTRAALLTGDGVAALLGGGAAGATDPRAIVTDLMAGVDAYAGAGVRDDQCLLVAVATGPG